MTEFNFTMSAKDIEIEMLKNMNGGYSPSSINVTPKAEQPSESDAYAMRLDQLLKGYTDIRSQTWNFPTEPEIITYPQSGQQLHSMVLRVPILKTCVDNLVMQHFRSGPEVKPRFQSKCPRCGVEYQEFKEYCDDPDCVMQGAKCFGPDHSQKKIFQDWGKRVNRNNQMFTDIDRQYIYEQHVSDNSVVLATYEYACDEVSGEISGRRLIELNLSPPDSFRIIMDSHGVPGGLFYTCVEHRNVQYGKEKKDQPCPECGKPLYNVTACTIKRNSQGTVQQTEDVETPLIDGEWFFKPYYFPSTGYGVSPVYTVWMLASSLWYMDNLEMNTYKMGRPPKTMTIFNTVNAEGLKAQIRSEFQAAKENRNYPIMLAYPFEGKTPATVLNMLPTDQELQNLEHRADHRERISALFGVMPTFQADTSTGGGLNNEGMQITVTLIRLESLHKWEEEGFYKWLMNALNITDWVLKFPPLKEEDRMAVIQRKQSNLKMIGEVLNRGGGYRILNEEDLQFEVTGVMGALAAGGTGAGYKEMAGSEWSNTDWMKQDQSFAFSLNKSVQVIKNDNVREIISKMLIELEIVKSYPKETRKGAMTNVVFNAIGEMESYLKSNLGKYIRTGLDLAGHDYNSAEIDMGMLLKLMDEYKIPLPDDFMDNVMFILDRFDTTLDARYLDELGGFMGPVLENVYDTESSVFVNAGITQGYRLEDPEDMVYDYSWIGPDYSPGRSTLVCASIKEKFDETRARKGRVSLADAEGIIAEEGSRPHGKEKAFNLGRPFCPHYRCRHRIIGTPVLHKSVIYIRDRSDAPPGVTVYEGPNGGLYYETGHGDGSGNGNGQKPETPQKPESGGTDDGLGDGGRGADYSAVGVRVGNETWNVKFHTPGEKASILQTLASMGFKEVGDYFVHITEVMEFGKPLDESGKPQENKPTEDKPQEPPVQKSRRYILDRSEAPEGVDVKEGPMGGLYYETQGMTGKKPEESMIGGMGLEEDKKKLGNPKDTDVNPMAGDANGSSGEPPVPPAWKGAFNLTTEMPYYDGMLKNPEYFQYEKGIDFEIRTLSPKGYIQLCRQGGKNLDAVDKKLVAEYATKMKYGEKFPMIVLDYQKNGMEQEGRHRALAADLVGLKEIPCLFVWSVEPTEEETDAYLQRRYGYTRPKELPSAQKSDVPCPEQEGGRV